MLGQERGGQRMILPLALREVVIKDFAVRTEEAVISLCRPLAHCVIVP